MKEKERIFLTKTFQKVKEAEDRKERKDIEEDVESFRSIPYGPALGQALSLYIPRTVDAPYRLIVDIHGGAWVYGDENLNESYDKYLSSKGFAVASIGYRLLPEVDLPGMLSDVTEALNFLKGLEREYAIDSEHIALTGDSAGTHLSLFIIALQQKEWLRKLFELPPAKPIVDALVLSHPVAEMDDMNASRNKRFSLLITEEIKKMFTGREDIEESPIANALSWSDIAEGVTLPPTLVNSSMRDVFYPNTQKIMDVFEREKIEYTRHVWGDNYRRLGHIFSIVHPEWKEARMTNDNSLRFIEKYLGKAK